MTQTNRFQHPNANMRNKCGKFTEGSELHQQCIYDVMNQGLQEVYKAAIHETVSKRIITGQEDVSEDVKVAELIRGVKDLHGLIASYKSINDKKKAKEEDDEEENGDVNEQVAPAKRKPILAADLMDLPDEAINQIKKQAPELLPGYKAPRPSFLDKPKTGMASASITDPTQRDYKLSQDYQKKIAASQAASAAFNRPFEELKRRDPIAATIGPEVLMSTAGIPVFKLGRALVKASRKAPKTTSRLVRDETGFFGFGRKKPAVTPQVKTKQGPEIKTGETYPDYVERLGSKKDKSGSHFLNQFRGDTPTPRPTVRMVKPKQPTQTSTSASAKVKLTRSERRNLKATNQAIQKADDTELIRNDVRVQKILTDRDPVEIQKLRDARRRFRRGRTKDVLKRLAFGDPAAGRASQVTTGVTRGLYATGLGSAALYYGKIRSEADKVREDPEYRPDLEPDLVKSARKYAPSFTPSFGSLEDASVLGRRMMQSDDEIQRNAAEAELNAELERRGQPRANKAQVDRYMDYKKKQKPPVNESVTQITEQAAGFLDTPEEISAFQAAMETQRGRESLSRLATDLYSDETRSELQKFLARRNDPTLGMSAGGKAAQAISKIMKGNITQGASDLADAGAVTGPLGKAIKQYKTKLKTQIANYKTPDYVTTSSKNAMKPAKYKRRTNTSRFYARGK